MSPSAHTVRPPHAKHKHTDAFTLIELSIVLVIIGLIVGGVLTGRDLIRAAEVRSVITDIEKFNTAANTFKPKYGCTPGDCPNATTFWPAGTHCADGSASTNAAGATCNGNGDGIIQTHFIGTIDR